MQVTYSTTQNLGSTNLKNWCRAQTKVSHQAYADSNKAQTFSSFCTDVYRSHQCFDILNVLRCIHTMGINQKSMQSTYFLFIFYWMFLARISASIFSTSSGASTPWASWSTLITYNYEKQTETKVSALGWPAYAPYKKRLCYSTYWKNSSIQTVQVHRERSPSEQ